jgi:hypothetical protein
VEDCNLILYVIDAKVPERARLDIFERVNGGVPLTRQQMRNCLFMGHATRFLTTEAATELFREATGGSLNTSTMRDREFVNRFCAFQLLPLDDYRGDMDDFLARALKHMNTCDTHALEKLSAEFRTSLTNNYKLFGKHAFRKHTAGQENRGVINAALWDVMSTGLSHYPERAVNDRADALREAFYPLLADHKFIAAITDGPNHVRNVKCRFKKATAMFQEVFGADAAGSSAL